MFEIADTEECPDNPVYLVEMKEDHYGSDPSRIVEITYSTKLIDDALAQLLLFHLFIAFFTILLGCLVALYISRRSRIRF